MSDPSSNATATASPVFPTIPPVDGTLGAVIVGTFLSLILYGLSFHQSYQYYVNYPFDKFLLKSYVALILVLETLSSTLAMHACYYYAVTNYFFPQMLQEVVWSASLSVIIGAVSVALCQSFFAYRVSILGKRWWPLVIVVILLVMAELAISFVAAAKMFQLKTWALFDDWEYLLAIHNGISTLSDFLIAAALVHACRQSQTGSWPGDTKLGTAIVYTISTGLLTGVYHSVCFIISLALPHNLVYLGALIVGIRLYSNWLLAALNTRRSITDRQGFDVATSDNSPFGVSVRSTTQGGTQSFQSAKFVNPRQQALQNTSVTATTSDVLDIKITTELTRETSETFTRAKAPGY